MYCQATEKKNYYFFKVKINSYIKNSYQKSFICLVQCLFMYKSETRNIYLVPYDLRSFLLIKNV